MSEDRTNSPKDKSGVSGSVPGYMLKRPISVTLQMLDEVENASRNQTSTNNPKDKSGE